MAPRADLACIEQCYPGSRDGYDRSDPISLPHKVFRKAATQEIRKDRTVRRVSPEAARGNERTHIARRLSAREGAGGDDAFDQLALYTHRHRKKRTALSHVRNHDSPEQTSRDQARRPAHL